MQYLFDPKFKGADDTNRVILPLSFLLTMHSYFLRSSIAFGRRGDGRAPTLIEAQTTAATLMR